LARKGVCVVEIERLTGPPRPTVIEPRLDDPFPDHDADQVVAYANGFALAAGPVCLSTALRSPPSRPPAQSGHAPDGMEGLRLSFLPSLPHSGNVFIMKPLLQAGPKGRVSMPHEKRFLIREGGRRTR
jgi:hypothetical protein